MAQTEDTELRDLVIEALEKNGSLAKIRALLRANVFLAFEDEFDNIKQKSSLDNVLKLPEGILALSVVHEFLEYCNLKNTLFVYMSESRQGKEYNYEGRNYLNEKLNLYKQDVREPILITLIKSFNQSKYFEHGNGDNRKQVKLGNNYRDEENCTYIVHEDSQGSNTSNSHSDNMSDDKNKLHLRLQLENSDTDTSSDSAREKSSSEYIPSEHFIRSDKSIQQATRQHNDAQDKRSNLISHIKEQNILQDNFKDLKMPTNSSSDSTSYVELKPYSDIDGKILNTENLDIVGKQENVNKKDSPGSYSKNNLHSKSIDTPKSSSSSTSYKDDKNMSKTEKKSSQSLKSEADTAEYSYDFASSPSLKNANKTKQAQSAESAVNTVESLQSSKKSLNKNLSIDNQQHSSHSSVSISDVADLISDKSSSAENQSRNDKYDQKSSVSIKQSSKKSLSNQSKVHSDDSGDFTESPVPSLSNLSLDIHSD